MDSIEGLEWYLADASLCILDSANELKGSLGQL